MRITGIVFSGKGEGKYFVSLSGYQKQFEEKLGLKPFPGTLNLKVNPEEAEDFLLYQTPLLIQGFKQEGRDFGEIMVIKIEINDLPAFLVIPEKTHYKKDVFEVLSEKCLRDVLRLSDGDKITVKGSE